MYVGLSKEHEALRDELRAYYDELLTPEVVDRCQNHVLDGSRVRRHYLTHKYNAEKRKAWTRLGAAIEGILKTPSTATRTRKRQTDAFQAKVIVPERTQAA